MQNSTGISSGYVLFLLVVELLYLSKANLLPTVDIFPHYEIEME